MADFDDPRPSSQPIGSIDLAAAKDNLIVLDHITVSDDNEIDNRKGEPRKTLKGLENALDDYIASTEQRIFILEDSEIFPLPPKAFVLLQGLAPNSLEGIILSTFGADGKFTLILSDIATGAVYSYITGADNGASGYNGQLTQLQADTQTNLGGYTEDYATNIINVDASLFNVVKHVLSSSATISFINVPASVGPNRAYSCSFSVKDAPGGATIGFPPMTQYVGGVKPVITSGGTDEFYLRTFGDTVADPNQGGAMVLQWYCSAIQNFGVSP